MGFLNIRFLDIIDILLVAFLLYQLYMLIKGTVAINIFVGIFSTYLIWLIAKALNMQLLSNILGQVMGVGVIALLIVFHQEIRRFLFLIGTRYFSKRNFTLEYLFSYFITDSSSSLDCLPIVQACKNMAKTKTGALIVISKDSKLDAYMPSGDVINSDTTCRILETIFFKNSPLHDGAILITGNKILAAACVLPVSESTELSKSLGLRHRAALGISEITDAYVIIVSEETGNISTARFGVIRTNISADELLKSLDNTFSTKREQDSSVTEESLSEALR